MPTPAPETRRILIVSDHAGSSDALAAHLTRHGFVVVGEVRTAATAVLAARTCDPDLVIVDAVVRGGWRPVAAALDGIIPRTRIVVLASYLGADDAREARAAGIGATLLKHVEGGSLANRLRALVGVA